MKLIVIIIKITTIRITTIINIYSKICTIDKIEQQVSTSSLLKTGKDLESHFLLECKICKT